MPTPKNGLPYLLAVDLHAADAPNLFTQSLRKTGFAVLKNHPIDPKAIAALYAEWAQFFSHPQKRDYLYNRETQEGFFPLDIAEKAKGYSIKDLKEFYHYFPWGRFPDFMSNKTNVLRDELSALAAELLKWVESSLPDNIAEKLSMPLSEMILNSPRTLLRILHYPPLSGKEEEGAIRAAAHEDIDLITLLPVATATGLQILDLDGQWHDVPCEPGMIIVNAGDMLQECTGGYFRSTTHRVLNPEGEAAKISRYSMPLFLQPRLEVRLSERYTAEEYWRERIKEQGIA